MDAHTLLRDVGWLEPMEDLRPSLPLTMITLVVVAALVTCPGFGKLPDL